MTVPLAGKTALITGASTGIGRGIALELARCGANIVINHLDDPQGAAALARQIEALRAQAIAVRADISSADDVSRLFRETLAVFPRLDILVNNAAIQVFRSLLNLTEDEWDSVIATNLKGCFLCTQQAARHMKDHSGGRIVNIGSGCNKIAFPGLVSYTASKGGIEMFTKSAAVELGRYGITVNCVAPGATETDRTRAEIGDFAGTWAPHTPLGRIGNPQDVAHAVAFLASDAANFITGQTLAVDGGLFARPVWPYPALD
jgi:NAD(P)-dependent dehydrogenase (short-subunit alcohol dehydrogenase family)